uniref:uncharacterized protein n=1 Tax=Myxine glutinosa TaxID=7769 RepID=UPI00358F13A2
MESKGLRAGLLKNEMRYYRVMEDIFFKYSHEFHGSPEVNLTIEIPSGYEKLDDLLNFGCRKRKQEGEAKFGKEKCLKREIKVSLQRPSPSSTSWDMRGWRPPDDQKSFPHHIPFGRMVLRSAQSKKFNDTCPADILVETDDRQISSSPFQVARNTSQVSLQRPSPSSTSWDMRGWRPPDDQKSFPHHIPFGRMVLRSAQSKKFNDTCPADILVETDDRQISSSPFQVARNTSQVSLQRPSPSSTSWDMRGWRPPDDQKSFPHHIPFGRMVLRSAQSKKFNDTCPADILVETDDWQISSSPFQVARNTSQGNEVSLHMSSPCSPVWDMRGWRSPDEQKSFPLDISFGRMVLRSARSKKFNETYPPDILEETDYWQSRSSFLNIPVDILTPERSHQQLGSSPFQVARNTSQGNEVSSHMSSPCSPVWEMSGWRSPDEQKSFPLNISFGRLVLRSARSKKFNETYPADILEETDYRQSRSSFLNIPVDILTPERSHQQLGSSPFQVARNTSQDGVNIVNACRRGCNWTVSVTILPTDTSIWSTSSSPTPPRVCDTPPRV